MTDHSKYEQMCDDGAKPQDVYAALKTDQYGQLDAIRVLRQVFDLSLVEAKEITVVGDGLAPTLSTYQGQLYDTLKGEIHMAIIEDLAEAGYTIRLATQDDVPTIIQHRRAMFLDMNSTSFLNTPGIDEAFTEWVTPRIASGEYIGFLAVDEQNTVIAGAGARILDWMPQAPDLSTRRVYVMNVFVDEAHRRQGIARLLIDTLLEWCRAQGFHHVILHASDKGRPLYESVGFEATNEMRLLLL